MCPTEIAAFGKLEKEFKARDAQLLGVSIDSEFVHHAWRRRPRKSCGTCRSRCSRTSSASSRRARHPRPGSRRLRSAPRYIVDPQGVIRFVYVTDLNVGRSPEEVLRVLDALQTDELCPCNWKKGEDTLQGGVR